ncbi:MAG: pyrimidine 5'-nucleotidase [Chloroflexi bacterium]|nr:pyrimidine 5'-nucleotidase [Chloroflexota bacterium]
MPISHLVFDLDDTLYPPGNGLWDEIGERINSFMIERAHIDPAQVNEVRRRYYQTYGTSLRGLMTDFPHLSPDDYLAYVHDVDLEHYIQPSPALDEMLATLPGLKSIFTNADAHHANRVLARLGVARHFESIVDIRAMNFENKPLPHAYQVLLTCLNARAADCILVEDSPRNLRPAKVLGMTTILVGDGLTPDPAVDFRVEAILETGKVIKSLAFKEREEAE